jgi:uncharacterized protein YkwD
MRTSLFLTALFCAQIAIANDAATPNTAAADGKVIQAAATASATVQPRPLHRHPTLFGMLVRSNDVRRSLGLQPHRVNPALTKAAMDHAKFMAATGHFSHDANGGPQNRALRHGFRSGVRENIAYGTRTIDYTFEAWVDSPGHYAAIISDTTDAGFGYAISPNGVGYFVGVYGTPPAGDEIGETEEQIFIAFEQEKKAQESAVQQASAEVPVKPEAKPEPMNEPMAKAESEAAPMAKAESEAAGN